MDECTKALNTGDIQLVWEPLGQLTQQVEKVTLSGSGRTKDMKVLRMRKELEFPRTGTECKVDVTWMPERTAGERVLSHWSVRGASGCCWLFLR